MEEVIKSILSGAGVAGAVLAWHLFVVDRRLRKIEEAIDSSTRSDLLRLAASPHVAPDLKEAATAIMKEIEARDTDRKKAL